MDITRRLGADIHTVFTIVRRFCLKSYIKVVLEVQMTETTSWFLTCLTLEVQHCTILNTESYFFYPVQCVCVPVFISSKKTVTKNNANETFSSA